MNVHNDTLGRFSDRNDLLTIWTDSLAHAEGRDSLDDGNVDGSVGQMRSRADSGVTIPSDEYAMTDGNT